MFGTLNDELFSFRGDFVGGQPHQGTLTFPSGHSATRNWNVARHANYGQFIWTWYNSIFEGNLQDGGSGRFMPGDGTSYYARVTNQQGSWNFTGIR